VQKKKNNKNLQPSLELLLILEEVLYKSMLTLKKVADFFSESKFKKMFFFS
jgi:hypothetical protein